MVDASTVAGAARWIASALIEEGKYLYGVEDQVQSLQSDLECMQELVQRVDANPDLVREDGQLRIFTQKIRELAFRAENAIDTYVVDVGSKVYMRNVFLKLACLMSHAYPVHMLRMQIGAIQQDMQASRTRFKEFRSIIQRTGSSRSRQQYQQPISAENYIHLDDVVVVGIGGAITQLVNRLTNLDDNFKVLAVVGTGGAGKTTLATQLYFHNKVASLFTYKAFVSVSQKWSRIDLLSRIFKQVMGDKEEIPSSESELVKRLGDFLKDKKYLVVLDDIWKKDAWEDVCPILSCSKGCRVVLTTRNREVPLHADNKCVIHEPQVLSEDEKWALFRKVAMEGRPYIESNADFEKLGKKMLAKFRGLPLAVVTLAGVLRTKRELFEWEEISDACADYILKGKGKANYGVVGDMLELSYLDLPAYLKPCFIYLAIFPEDFNIPSNVLIGLWIAEGFITKDLLGKGQGTLEDVGMQLLNELSQRCMLKVTNRNVFGQIERFRLHDLMGELCRKKAKEYQFVDVILAPASPDVELPTEPRRLAVFSRKDFRIKTCSLRTIVDFDSTAGSSSNASMIRNLERCKLLRVWNVWDGGYLAERIGKLMHLRFLCILNSNLRELPKSIQSLRNLLYLFYTSNKDEAKVPDDLVCKMENLRGLFLPPSLKRGSESFNSNFELNCSKSLHTLSSGAGIWMTKDLPELSLTVQSIVIHDIQKSEEIKAIYEIPSIIKGRLCTLVCHFNRKSASKEMRKFNLRKLKCCKKLRGLELYDCPLVNDCTRSLQFPPNLVKSCLSFSKIEEREEGDDLMQILGNLSRLKFLSLENDAYLGKTLSCKAGAFPQLEELELKYLYSLEQWTMEEGAMARLVKLRLSNCSLLTGLPRSIKFITTLKELEVEMPGEFCKRLGYGKSSKEAYSYIIRHIPSIILNVRWCPGR